MPKISLKANHLKVLGKSQLSAALATAVDYCALVLMVEVLALYYVFSTALAALLGGVANFILNRRWAFQSSGRVHHESAKYLCVWIGSLVLNVSLVWSLTEFLPLPYIISKIITSLSVGLLWNYPLHRYWVFSVPITNEHQ